ncbi:MAG TPA: C1 family peptidase [Solirubrobacterales bacterium]|nr:C1 family peptidase [Solirubrobacterales bacterium]
MGFPVQLQDLGESRGLGWVPDYPDVRDYTPGHEEVSSLLAKTSVPESKQAALPGRVDLRQWCSPVEDQGHLNSCTAHAGVGMLEYFERKACGKYVDASRLFLYKATRRLLGLYGDTGATLRSTAGAMTLFGVPPEQYWPYLEPDFENEPPAFCYAFAENYQAIKYYRLDPPGTKAEDVLGAIKSNLASNLPSMFGFTVYSSMASAGGTGGKVPFPAKGDKVRGGHAVMAVGYDDSMALPGGVLGKETRGALLFRNSWGSAWGDQGYGWLSYDYVRYGIAQDWWVLISQEWVDTEEFTKEDEEEKG